jgi:hypothetical protein
MKTKLRETTSAFFMDYLALAGQTQPNRRYSRPYLSRCGRDNDLCPKTHETSLERRAR